MDNNIVYAYARLVGSLPLSGDFIEKVGFCDIINTICPSDPQAFLSYGDVTKILIADRLCAPRPLYKVEEWSEKSGVEAVFGIPSHYLNNDKCGRTLEVFADNAQR